MIAVDAGFLFALVDRNNAPLMRKYAKLPMDLADGTLVMLAEHLGHGHILSTDERDFSTYRWKNRQPFHNLLAR